MGIALGALFEAELGLQKEHSGVFVITTPVVIFLSVPECFRDRIPIRSLQSAVHIVQLQIVSV